jgi:monoamine oxidase
MGEVQARKVTERREPRRIIVSEKSNRRQLLKKGAIAATGAGALLGHAGSASASQAERSADVCVIGAGYAGMAAAWALRKAGRSVIVLEARPRIGGRIWSTKLSDGTPIDLGGAWVSATQPGILGLAQEMGISTYPQYTRGPITLVHPDGRAFYYRQLAELLPIFPDEITDLGVAFETIHSMAQAINVEAPWEKVSLPELGPGKTSLDADALTVANWLETRMATPVGRALLGKALTGAYGLEPAAVSLLHLLFQTSTSPARRLEQFLGTGPGEASSLRVNGGAEAIADAIAARLPRGSIYLNAPVRAIHQEGQRVEVVTDRILVRARRAIVAIPTSVAGYIRFTPILPPDRAQLMQRFPHGTVWKIWLVYDEAFWRKPQPGLPDGVNGNSVAPGSIVGITIDAGLQEGRDKPGLLNAFVEGDAARQIARLSPGQRRQLILDEMVKRFGPQAAQLSTRIVFPATRQPYVEKNWAEEEWVRGDFVGTPGPGVHTGFGFGPALREPFGLVHWAGVDTATRWYGTMDSAVQSGQRAAAEVLQVDPIRR